MVVGVDECLKLLIKKVDMLGEIINLELLQLNIENVKDFFYTTLIFQFKKFQLLGLVPQCQPTREY